MVKASESPIRNLATDYTDYTDFKRSLNLNPRKFALIVWDMATLAKTGGGNIVKLNAKYVVFIHYRNHDRLRAPAQRTVRYRFSTSGLGTLSRPLNGGCCRTPCSARSCWRLRRFSFPAVFRQRFTKVHRVMGRFYVLGALVLAPTGAYIQYFQEGAGAPRSFTILGLVDAAMLIGTTLLAGLFAFRRKINLHRQWAIRSYSVALVFITGRFTMGVTGWETLGVEVVQAIIWSCLALSMVFADVAIHWRELVELFSAKKERKPVEQPRLARAA